jgi:hypothetical protein
MAEMSKIEEVARAIWREREKQFPERVRRPEPDTFDNASGAWDMVLDQARAAIEAMREPTEKQLDAVRYLVQWHTFEHPTEAALLRHAGCLRKPAPEGCRDVEHVPPTNMVSYWIHRGIIDAALSKEVAG